MALGSKQEAFRTRHLNSRPFPLPSLPPLFFRPVISEINIKADLRSQGVGKAALHLLMSALAHPDKDAWNSCKGAFLIPAIILDTEPENMDDRETEEEEWSDHDSDVSSIEELPINVEKPLPPTVVANRERNLQRVNSFFLDVSCFSHPLPTHPEALLILSSFFSPTSVASVALGRRRTWGSLSTSIIRRVNSTEVRLPLFLPEAQERSLQSFQNFH